MVGLNGLSAHGQPSWLSPDCSHPSLEARWCLHAAGAAALPPLLPLPRGGLTIAESETRWWPHICCPRVSRGAPFRLSPNPPRPRWDGAVIPHLMVLFLFFLRGKSPERSQHLLWGVRSVDVWHSPAPRFRAGGERSGEGSIFPMAAARCAGGVLCTWQWGITTGGAGRGEAEMLGRKQSILWMEPPKPCPAQQRGSGIRGAFGHCLLKGHGAHWGSVELFCCTEC